MWCCWQVDDVQGQRVGLLVQNTETHSWCSLRPLSGGKWKPCPRRHSICVFHQTMFLVAANLKLIDILLLESLLCNYLTNILLWKLLVPVANGWLDRNWTWNPNFVQHLSIVCPDLVICPTSTKVQDLSRSCPTKFDNYVDIKIQDFSFNCLIILIPYDDHFITLNQVRTF